MQQLHLVGFTTDNEGLIFSTKKGAKSGGYVVALDKRLFTRMDEVRRRRDAVAEETGRRPTGRPDSVLSPREIQGRLRSGRTIAQVAREAGVDEEWVDKFAPPIAAEQARVIDQAQELVFSKTRLGPSAQNLGESVRWNLIDRGIILPDDIFSGSWSAFHVRDGLWIVRFAYVYRKKLVHAEWEVDLREETIAARNRHGAELAFVEQGRRRKRLPKAAVPAVLAPKRAAPAAAPKAAPKSSKRARSTAKRRPTAANKGAKRGRAAAKKKVAAARPAARRPAAKRASRAKRPSVRKASTKPLVAPPARTKRPQATRPEPTSRVPVPRPAPPALAPRPPAPRRFPERRWYEVEPPRPEPLVEAEPAHTEVEEVAPPIRIDSRRPDPTPLRIRADRAETGGTRRIAPTPMPTPPAEPEEPDEDSDQPEDAQAPTGSLLRRRLRRPLRAR